MPDLTFFPDPNVDRVLGVVMKLAAEVYMLRDRLSTVERVLERVAMPAYNLIAGLFSGSRKTKSGR